MIILKPDDYFRYNSPFRIWLGKFKGKQLGDFKTDEAREIFSHEFLPDWNGEKLPKEFYLKGPEMKPKDFKEPIKKEEKFGFSKQEESKLFSHKLYEAEEHYQQKSGLTQVIDKSHYKRRLTDLEEIIPKKEGHAKLIEDKRIKSSYTRMERNNPHDLELPDDQLFSGSTTKRISGTDDYKTLLRLEREKSIRKEKEIAERRQEKEKELKGKIEKYNQREKEVQNILKKMINKG